jgi:hypothetical protein
LEPINRQGCVARPNWVLRLRLPLLWPQPSDGSA